MTDEFFPRDLAQERFFKARDLSRPISDSQYVAWVDGRVRMALTTYEKLVNAAVDGSNKAEEPAPPVKVSGTGTMFLMTKHWSRNGSLTEPACREGNPMGIGWLGATDPSDVTCPACLDVIRNIGIPVDRSTPELSDTTRDAIERNLRRATSKHDNGEPLFVHDCDECIFLTRFKGQDLYFHPGQMSTVIARRSGQAEDYTSGLAAAEHDSNLAMAYTLAHRRGLLR